MTFTYSRDIPDGPHNPSNDQPSMKINTNSIDDLINVDHISFGLANGGTHKQVNLTNEVSPTRLSDLVLYSKLAGGQSSLWAKNSSQDLPLFTGLASGGTNGYTSVYGGLIIQWGQITSTASSFQPLTFSTNNIAFPLNCFSIFTQPYGSGTVPGSQATVEIRKSTVTKLGFEWAFVTNSSEYTGFYWWAIGN